MERIVTVRMLDAPYRADRDYDYLLPEEYASEGGLRGRIAAVPFGQGNRTAYAVVTGAREGMPERRLKRVYLLLPADLSLREDILSLCLFLHEHTLCGVGEAVRAAMPTAAFHLLREEYGAEPSAVAQGRNAALLDFLREHGPCEAGVLAEVFGSAARRALSSLIAEGLAYRRVTVNAERRVKTERVYRVAEPESASVLLTEKGVFRNEGQRKIFLFLLDNRDSTEQEIIDRLNVSASPLRTMTEKGLLICEAREVDRNPYAAVGRRRDTSPVVLSRAQQQAYEALHRLYAEKKPACALLHGVTGSGKTRVMMRLLDDVLAEGRQAILLVPEIALTPQTVGIFCSRYGDRVSVLHSSLSAGERLDAYRKILGGGANLVIGTRSAVFAPLSRLGLIIIDEEHEHTYKSDASPRYHTKDVAAFRCGAHNALTVLASATPSIESYYKAKTGKYTLVPLAERYGGVPLPETEIVDMREELRAGNTSSISHRLAELLTETAREDGQAILFLNRRGYHRSVSCRACGEALLCPHCSVSLTYHATYGDGYLLCHACGGKSPLPRTCPACDADALAFLGAGTQKAEAELSSVGDGLRVLRMDADTTGSKSAYERLLGAFRRGEADVLLGTQMVTKGHDFPRVALSGVLLADTSLYTSDFRAAERTFSLLTQVIGRAGRAGAVGRAVIQTLSPTHRVIELSARQDYVTFYEEEVALRRARHLPPFADMAEVLLVGTDEERLCRAAQEASETLAAAFKSTAPDLPVEIYGPLEPQVYKVAEKYRLKLLIKCRLVQRVRRLFGDFLRGFGAARGDVAVSVDLNPADA